MLGEVLTRRIRVLRMRRDAGADRGRAEVDLAQLTHHMLEAETLLGERNRERLELLPQRHGRGVLQLRAADLHDAGELAALGMKRRRQRHQLDLQALQRQVQADFQRGGIRVVGALGPQFTSSFGSMRW